MNPHEPFAHVQQQGDAALAARLKEIKIFDKRWDLLKEVLEPLFMRETVGSISNAMERRFSFRARSAGGLFLLAAPILTLQ